MACSEPHHGKRRSCRSQCRDACWSCSPARVRWAKPSRSWVGKSLRLMLTPKPVQKFAQTFAAGSPCPRWRARLFRFHLGKPRMHRVQQGLDSPPQTVGRRRPIGAENFGDNPRAAAQVLGPGKPCHRSAQAAALHGGAAVAGRQLLHLRLSIPQAHEDLEQLGVDAGKAGLRHRRLPLRAVTKPGLSPHGGATRLHPPLRQSRAEMPHSSAALQHPAGAVPGDRLRGQRARGHPAARLILLPFSSVSILLWRRLQTPHSTTNIFW